MVPMVPIKHIHACCQLGKAALAPSQGLLIVSTSLTSDSPGYLMEHVRYYSYGSLASFCFPWLLLGRGQRNCTGLPKRRAVPVGSLPPQLYWCPSRVQGVPVPKSDKDAQGIFWPPWSSKHHFSFPIGLALASTICRMMIRLAEQFLGATHTGQKGRRLSCRSTMRDLFGSQMVAAWGWSQAKTASRSRSSMVQGISVIARSCTMHHGKHPYDEGDLSCPFDTCSWRFIDAGAPEGRWWGPTQVVHLASSLLSADHVGQGFRNHQFPAGTSWSNICQAYEAAFWKVMVYIYIYLFI